MGISRVVITMQNSKVVEAMARIRAGETNCFKVCKMTKRF